MTDNIVVLPNKRKSDMKDLHENLWHSVFEAMEQGLAPEEIIGAMQMVQAQFIHDMVYGHEED